MDERNRDQRMLDGLVEGICDSDGADVSAPKSWTFEGVNDWVHGVDVGYEDLQGAVLTLAAMHDRLLQTLGPAFVQALQGDFSAVDGLARRANIDFVDGRPVVISLERSN